MIVVMSCLQIQIKSKIFFCSEKLCKIVELTKNSERGKNEKKGKTFIYNWHNRLKLKNSLSVSAKEVNEKIKSGAPYVVRFLMWNNGDDEVVRCPDIIRGNVDVDCKLLDDKILYKKLYS